MARCLIVLALVLVVCRDRIGGNECGGSTGTTIGRATLDGTGVDQGFVTGASTPGGVAVG